jgi:hypothetical protein
MSILPTFHQTKHLEAQLLLTKLLQLDFYWSPRAFLNIIQRRAYNYLKLDKLGEGDRSVMHVMSMVLLDVYLIAMVERESARDKTLNFYNCHVPPEIPSRA